MFGKVKEGIEKKAASSLIKGLIKGYADSKEDEDISKEMYKLADTVGDIFYKNYGTIKTMITFCSGGVKQIKKSISQQERDVILGFVEIIKTNIEKQKENDNVRPKQ